MNFRTTVYLCLIKNRNELCVGETGHLVGHIYNFAIYCFVFMYNPIFPLQNRQFNLCEPIPVLNETQIHCSSKIHTSCP